jgi:hypothetical protein
VEFLNAVSATDPAGRHPNAIEQFLGAHPAAQRFVQIRKPIPSSFARESFFAVSAFKFTNADGLSRYGRYRVLPVAGNEYLGETKAAARGPNFLFDEIKERVARALVRFRVAVQLAEGSWHSSSAGLPPGPAGVSCVPLSSKARPTMTPPGASPPSRARSCGTYFTTSTS